MPKVGGMKDLSNHRTGKNWKNSTKLNIRSHMPEENIYTFPIIAPRWYQLPVWKAYNNGAKDIVLSLPRRHGKDLTSVSIAIDYALRNPHSSVVLLAPTKAQARRIYWDKGQSFEVKDPITGHRRKIGGSLLDVCLPERCRKTTNNTDAKITLANGSSIQLYGTDEGGFIGMKINFVVVSEMAKNKKDIFPLLSPILEESGGITIYNGTVTDENNHFWEKIQSVSKLQKEGDKEAFCHYLTLEDTKTAYWISTPDERGNIDISINAELAGKINPKTGATYANLERRVRLGESKSYVIRERLNIPTFTEEGSYYEECLKFAIQDNRISDLIVWNPHLSVCTAWDIGHSDKTCIVFFQQSGDDIVIIDYYENSKKGPDHYIDIVRSKPYRYRAHFAPHDISQRKWGMKQSALDLCKDEYGFLFYKIPQSLSTVDDINVCRSYFQKCSFVKSGCRDLLNSLMNYRENPNTYKPEHDEHSHGADAFRYMVLAIHKNLIPPHDLMGNNTNLYSSIVYPANLDDVNTNIMIDGDGFPTCVETMEQYFPDSPSWLGGVW